MISTSSSSVFANPALIKSQSITAVIEDDVQAVLDVELEQHAPGTLIMLAHLCKDGISITLTSRRGLIMFEILSKLLPWMYLLFLLFLFPVVTSSSSSASSSFSESTELRFKSATKRPVAACLVNFANKLGPCLYSTATFFELGDFFAVIATRLVDVFDNVINLFMNR